jgi:hypothetical protein
VHHADNPEYIDKNHSQFFIIWDKLFHQREGLLFMAVTRTAQTWNPIRINFQHLGLLISDAWRADNWKDTFGLNPPVGVLKTSKKISGE